MCELKTDLGFPRQVLIYLRHLIYFFCFFFKGFKDIVSTAKSRLSLGERAVFWMYDKIREWSRLWLTHFFLLFIAAGYCAAGAWIFQTVEAGEKKKELELIFNYRNHLITDIAEVSILDF